MSPGIYRRDIFHRDEFRSTASSLDRRWSIDAYHAGSLIYATFESERLGMTLHRENPPAEDLALLYRVSRALLREGEYGELLSGLLDTRIEGLGADRGFVAVREAGSFEQP